MATRLLNDRDIEFLLYELLDTESLCQREAYAEHSRAVFDATLDAARDIAERYFVGHNAEGDANEPRYEDGRVVQIPQTKAAWQAFAEGGFLAAHYPAEDGGLQLPEIVLRAALAHFNAANVATAAYPFLTIGAANLIHSFGSAEQKALYLPAMQDGRYAGTMALTEPDQGSALADIRTSARPDGQGGYRLFGQKMFISGGDQALTENIVHMVLARIEGAPAGIKGISLFICPKVLVNPDGSLGARNDVALAGLLHKMGYRNTTSTVLKFGEGEGAQAYLVGEAGRGLQYMFQMMNEARIGVALGAACLGYQGYNASLDYARERLQGRHPTNKDPTSPQLPIIQHADVRRMLLAQKAYVEGALAMCFWASSLVEEARSAPAPEARERAGALLDFITPVVKSWPSRYCVEANALAIQVLGGSGYIREYPLEQYYRDNRLNPIHEGTEGIHGLDLLGRKLPQAGGAAYRIFREEVLGSVAQARTVPACADLAAGLEQAVATLDATSFKLLAALGQNPDLGLANATIYLDLFGRVTAAWIWLRQALVASRALERGEAQAEEQNFFQGKLQAARYYIEWELPAIQPQASLLQSLNRTPLDMRDAWF